MCVYVSMCICNCIFCVPLGKETVPVCATSMAFLRMFAVFYTLTVIVVITVPLLSRVETAAECLFIFFSWLFAADFKYMSIFAVS